MAGTGGIEPTLKVLETFVLPLYDVPMAVICWIRVMKKRAFGK